MAWKPASRQVGNCRIIGKIIVDDAARSAYAPRATAILPGREIPSMDAATSTPRKFPGFTTAELKRTVARFYAGENLLSTPETIAAIELEISRRDAGLSVPFVVPQVPPLRLKAGGR